MVRYMAILVVYLAALAAGEMVCQCIPILRAVGW